MAIDRDMVVLTERSRILAGQDCETKRYLGYYAGPEGRGVSIRAQSEEPMIGIWTHNGIEKQLRWRFWGELYPKVEEEFIYDLAREASQGFREEALARGMAIEDDEGEMRETVPEWWQRLAKDGENMVEGLSIAFGLKVIPKLVERYELVSVEEEIPWLLGRLRDGRYIVMMSRLDGVLRDLTTGMLVSLELKTKKEWGKRDLREAELDTQGITQAEAIAQRWGRDKVGGSIYVGLIKGGKYPDKEWDGLRRYGNSLITPYVRRKQWNNPNPSDIAWSYQWSDDTGGGHTLSSYTWGRRGVDEIGMTMRDWIKLVAEGAIRQPEMTEGEDWLEKVISISEPIIRPEWEREKWKTWAIRNEGDWVRWLELDKMYREAERIEVLGRENINPLWEAHKDHTCYKFGDRGCAFIPFCLEGRSLEDKMEEGKWVVRVPNHGEEREER